MMQEVNEAARQPMFTAEQLVIIIAAIANAIVLVRTNWALKQTQQDLKVNTEMTSKNTEITAATYTEAKVISGHVNSERSMLNEKLASVDRENDILKTELTESKQVAALLAQTASQVVRQRQPDPNQPHNRRAEDKLAQIETNTRETSEGIQELKTAGTEDR